MTLEERVRNMAGAVFLEKELEVPEGCAGYVAPTAIKKLRRAVIKKVDGSVTLEFVEQNPETGTKWAQMAKDGHKVGWVFKNGYYYARYVDDKVEKL